jgi:hypothetical protein
LKKELETYEAHKLDLIGRAEGKYVLIQDSQIIDVWDTYEDALKAGYAKFGLTAFLVKQVTGIEQVHFFTRDLTPCR